MARKNFYRVSTVLFVAATFAGCKTRGFGEHTDASAKHEVGKISRIKGPQAWRVFKSQQEWENHPASAAFRDSLLEDTAPIMQKIKFWVNTIDKTLRVAFPAEMAGVPTPIVVVSSIGGVDAFNIGTLRCFKTGLANKGTSAPQIMLIGQVARAFAPGEFCQEQIPTTEQSAAMNFVGQTIDCPLRARGASMAFDESCFSRLSPTGVGQSKTFGYTVSSNVVEFNVALIKALDEHEFVATLAHELSHLYRAHLSPSTNYNFFYKFSDLQDQRPTPNAAVNEIGARLMANSAPYWQFYKIKGMQLMSTNLLTIFSTLVEKVEAGELSLENLSAQPAELKTKFDAFAKALQPLRQSMISRNRLLKEMVPTEIAAQYLAAESSAVAMAPLIQVRSAASTHGLSVTQVKDLHETFLQDTKVPELPAIAKQAKNLMNVVQGVQKKMTAVDTLYEKASNEGIGQYTTEQEADELGLEILLKLGISSQAALNQTLRLNDLSFSRRPTGSFSPAQCRALADNNWKTPEGKNVVVPIGDYQEAHHNACFRAFELSREMRRHKFSEPTGKPVSSPGKAWKELTAELSIDGGEL